MRRATMPRPLAGALGLTLLLATTAAAVVLPEFGGPERGAVTDHVVIISIDGLRPDAIAGAGAKTLRRLMREGAYSLEAQTIFPSKTLPSHTSMLTGVPPEVHGITWNNDQVGEHGHVSVETVFERAKAAGFSTAAFFSKSKFHHLQKAGTLDYTQAPGSGFWMADRTLEDVARYLRFEKPNLLFVHIAEPDAAGHTFGWMGTVYRFAVRRADDAVAQVLRAADNAFGAGNYSVIVTADHGGHADDHGSADPRDMTIPWIAWGRGVAAGLQLQPGIRTMDTAATALWLLGVPAPEMWTGQPVASAYTEQARFAASAALPN